MNTFAIQVKRVNHGTETYDLSFDETVAKYNSYTQALDSKLKYGLRFGDAVSFALRLNEHYNRKFGRTLKQNLWSHVRGRRSQNSKVLINSVPFLGNKQLFDQIDRNARIQLVIDENWVSRKQ